MKTAVILFNLGGPDSLEAVEPFLRNLFSDPAIIGLPNPLRWLVAKLISSRRRTPAQAIYAKIGGKSPLRELTEAQAAALQTVLGPDHRCFVAMRYWHPFADETAKAVAAYAPDRIVLLPLYPHYSKTTTGSSFKDWARAAAAAFPNLTPRERDIVEWIARGSDNAQVAAQLALSEKTVRNHITSIFAKLEVENRSQAIVLARDAGFGKKSP